MDITNQDEFNKSVSAALYALYDVAVISHGTIAAGEPEAEAIRDRSDQEFRRSLAQIDAFAWRIERSDLPALSNPS